MGEGATTSKGTDVGVGVGSTGGLSPRAHPPNTIRTRKARSHRTCGANDLARGETGLNDIGRPIEQDTCIEPTKDSLASPMRGIL